MRISLFGTVGVAVNSDDGHPVELPHRPSIVLGVLAIHHGRTVRDDQLIDAIWPTETPATARQALQGYVVTVRNALEPDRPAGEQSNFVVRESVGYRLIVDEEQLDLAEFEMHAASIRPGMPERTLDRLIQLSDQPVAADLADADWAMPVRTRVAEQRLAALAERFDLELEASTGEKLLSPMRAAVSEYPYDERLVGSLMTALYRSDRQAEALAAYDGLRRRLRDELGVTPGERVAAIQLDVLNQSPALDLPDHPALRPDGSFASSPRDDLLGRSDDVSALSDVLLARRSVTVVGPGGVGKTTLVGAVLDEVGQKFAAVAIIDVSTTGEGSILDLMVRSIGADQHPLLSADEAIRAALGDRPHLFVLDTCEARLAEVRDAVDLLWSHASISILLATREPVRHRGEFVHRLSGLDIDDAVALLRSLVGAGVDMDESSLRDLAVRVDQLPLAIEMIAPRVAALGASAVLVEITDAEPIVAPPSERSGPERHQSVDALVQWSLDRLGTQELALLTRCAAFRGPFPITALLDLPALATVPSETVSSALASLVDGSLVSRTGDDAATFAVFDTVRDVVARVRPDDFAAEQIVVDDHVVNTAWADYTGASEEPVDAWVAERFATTLGRLSAAPDHRGVMLATAAARRWLDLGALAQGSAALQQALGATPDVIPPLASIGWTVLGFNQVYQGELRAAAESYRRAATHAESVPMDGFVELVEASIAWLDCDFERSWTIASSAVKRMSTSSRRAPANLVGFAKSAVFAGDLEGAADCYATALRLSRDAQDRVAEANAIRLAAVVDALRGDHDRALGAALRSAALHRDAASTLGTAQAASTVALVAALAGDAATASSWSMRALGHARRQFDVQTICVVLPVVASLAVADGRRDVAAQLTGWLDRYLDEQRHVRHPTAATLFTDIDATLGAMPANDRRRLTAEGAAMSAAQMLELAADELT